MIYQLVVALAIAATASAKLFPEDPTHQKIMWEQFKAEWGRNFESMEEETHRFHVFLENLKLADHRNNQEQNHGGGAVHGITRFFDLSQAEFEARHLTADPSMKSSVGKNVWTPTSVVNTNAGLVDWTGTLATPVKDQGYCGSCWAFSATEQIESDAMRLGKGSYILSPLQITQCTKAAFGCGGGWTETAYQYVNNAGGVVQESDYPYSKTTYAGATGTCDVDTSKHVISITGYTTVQGESNMAAFVQSTGPLSVCLDASGFNSYNGGIMTVCGKSVNHCVQAVGVDASSGGFWKVRNSWGEKWGESGYIRLAYGQDTCAITNDPTFVDAIKA